MPKPIPVTANPAPMLERLRRTVRLMNKGQLSIHAKIGSEDMEDSELAENALAAVEEVERKIGEFGGKIRAAYIKTTMGRPVRVEVD